MSTKLHRKTKRKKAKSQGMQLASLNRQLARGGLSQRQRTKLTERRNELSRALSGTRISVVSGGLPSLPKRQIVRVAQISDKDATSK
jgi:hypothetical protein